MAVVHLAETLFSHLDDGAGCWNDLGSKQVQEGVTEALALLKQAAENRQGDEPGM
ncbi:MAG: hypothetical protein WBF04_10005 [Candidatus Sulfotelmatobacter sp.]